MYLPYVVGPLQSDRVIKTNTILSSNGRIPICGMGGVSSILTSMMHTA